MNLEDVDIAELRDRYDFLVEKYIPLSIEIANLLDKFGKYRQELQQEEKEAKENKPNLLPYKTIVTPKNDKVRNFTFGKNYKIQGHFCTLVSTIYGSNWNQFITLKNDDNWTVKVSLNKFNIV